MTRRAVIMLDASPAETGAVDWRRFLMLARLLRSLRFEVIALHVDDDRLDIARTHSLMGAADRCAFTSRSTLEDSAASLDARFAPDLALAMNPSLSPALAAFRRPLCIADLQSPVDEADQEALAQALAPAQLLLTAEPSLTNFAETLGRPAIEAPALIDGARKMRPRMRRSHLLAGAWVEADAVAIDAVRAFFAEVAQRGGGGAPNFAIAGPGAGEIAPPSLPFPVTRFGPEVSETAFYRGLDLAVAPDILGLSPRLDVVSALECGSVPLASSSALNGLRRRWRLPHFRELAQLADFLFERGSDLAEGGLLTELRARADWTWSGLVSASARQRERLTRRLREMLPSEGA